MSFSDALKAEANKTKTLTENGAVAYQTSGKALLDFNFAVTALRNARSDREITDMFSRAFYEDPAVAVKFLFWLRDPRGGLGERRIFRVCLAWLTDVRTRAVQRLLGLIPEYGRYDDLWPLLDTELRSEIIDLVDDQLTADQLNMEAGKPCSLLSKWMCSLNTSSAKTRKYATILSNGLALSPRDYRKKLSALRRYLDVVERKMTANEWSAIDYEAVPSKANLIYREAFLRHDKERRWAYLDSLQKGEAKINAGVLQPHEIVAKYTEANGWYGPKVVGTDDPTLEELWEALPDVTIGDTIVVEDTSGSMTNGNGINVRPIDVATALAVYMSEHNQGEWKDKIISFSTNPQFIDLSNCESLREKVKYIFDRSEVSNTDIERTMMLILNTAVHNHLTQEEMPRNILILSDLQFDEMTYIRGKGLPDATLFENIARVFRSYDYQMPRIIFWNLSGQVNKTIPMQENEMGVVLCSGFSVQLLKMVMSGKIDPYEVLLDTINVPRYDAVEQALKGIL